MNIVKQIKVFFAVLALLTVMTVPNAKAQNYTATQINMTDGFIVNLGNLTPSVWPFGFTNVAVAGRAIPVGQLAGHYADGTLITDYRDLLPFVGQSLEVVDANGETVAGMDQMGLYVVDPATSNAVAISVSNGVLSVGGTTLGSVTDTDEQSLSLDVTTLNIDRGTGVDLGTVFVTGTELMTLSNTFNMAISEVSDSVTSTSNTLASSITTVSNNVESVSNTLASSVSTLETTIMQGGLTNTVVNLADADGGGGVSEVTVSNGVILVDGMAVDTDTQLSEADVDNFVSDNGYLTEIDLSNLTNTVVTLEHAEGGGATSEITVSNGVLLVDGMAVDTTIPDTDDQTLTLTNTTLEIVDGNSVDLGATFATDQEVTDAINNAVGGDFQSDGSVSMTGDLNMGGNCITNTPCFWLTDPETGESVLFEFREGMIYIGGTPITPTAKAQQTISLESFTYFDAGSTNALDLVSGKTSTSDYEFQVVSNAMLTGSSTVSWTTNYTAFALRARALGDADYYTSPWVTAMYDLAEMGLEFPIGESKLTAGLAADDRFGRAVSVDGDTLVVGAYRSDAQGSNSGAAYVFTRSGAGWTLQAQLTGSSVAAGDNFGNSVSVHEDTVVVGAYSDDDKATNAGAAYVFTRSGTTWTEQAKLTASDGGASDVFGWSVSLHQDTVVVGAYRRDEIVGTDAGAAYVFTRSGTTWTQQQKLTASDATGSSRFGFSVSVHEDTIAAGANLDDEIASDAGAAYVFTRNGTTWTQQQKLTALDGATSDGLGFSVSVHDDTLAVGAYGIGANTGSAYVFTRSGTTWTQEAKLTAMDGAADDSFGYSISLHGHTMAVGAQTNDEIASDAGAAYVYTRNGTTWTQQQKLTASDGAATDYFGVSVSVGHTAVAVGAFLHDDGATSDTGAVYVYE